jgi:hypothetical protein
LHDARRQLFGSGHAGENNPLFGPYSIGVPVQPALELSHWYQAPAAASDHPQLVRDVFVEEVDRDAQSVRSLLLAQAESRDRARSGRGRLLGVHGVWWLVMSEDSALSCYDREHPVAANEFSEPTFGCRFVLLIQVPPRLTSIPARSAE